jgi:hypothetical protein
MESIKADSIDMLLVDLPYGTTRCRWDQIIPLDKLWLHYNRIVKYNGVMVFTAAQPFTSILISSNIKNYRYNWVWEKSKATGYLNSKRMPLKAHEDICVFYRKLPTYNPQMWQGAPYNKGMPRRDTDVYGKQREVLIKNDSGLRYPRTVQYFKTAESEGDSQHPTQKPVRLMRYLIETYTNEGDVVLDNTMGYGTTGIAALSAGRKFLGIELDPKWYELSNQRITKYLSENEE